MSMMGELKLFLGLQIKQCKDEIFINQTKYARDILKKFGMDGVKSSKTLMSSTTKLNKDKNGKSVDEKHFRGMIISLLYLIASRPDIMFATCLCEKFSKLMQGEFEMSMMGKLKLFLGLQIKQCKDEIFINQTKYAREILKTFGMDGVKSSKTPMNSTTKLNKDENSKPVDEKCFRGMIRSLLYLTASRPDIMFATCLCAFFNLTQRSLT